MITSAAMCDCDSLWVYDAPRPSLKTNDDFQVTPTCPDLIVDPAAIAPAPKLITLKGRRSETQLGAESVPVSVRIGSCCDVASAYHVQDGGEGLADADVTEAGTTMPSCLATAPAASCSAGLAPLDSRSVDGFELVALEQLGCRQRSPSQLECTLDANGEASFAVRGQLGMNALDLVLEYLPVCISAAFLDSPSGSISQEIRVIPHAGTARFAIAVVQVPVQETTPPVPSGTSCGSLSSCTTRRARAQFQAGIVSVDLPNGSIREVDFLQVDRSVPIKAQLATLTALSSGADAPFLSLDNSCAAPEGGASGALSLTIGQGERDSPPFFLCTTPEQASYRISPIAANGTAPDAGDTAASPGSLMARSLDATLSALTAGYDIEQSGGQDILFLQPCGGDRVRAPSSVVQSIAAPLSVMGESIVVQPCGSRAATMAADDASTSVADASADQDEAAICGPFTIELKAGGTCLLERN